MTNWDDYNKRQAFYRSKHWQDMRIYVLYRDKTCRLCSTPDRPVPATEVDHIQDLKDAPQLRLDPDNLQGLCKSCHSKKTFETKMKGSWEKTKDIKILNRKWNIECPSSGKC